MIPLYMPEDEYHECWMCGCYSSREQLGKLTTYLCGQCRDAIEGDEHDYVTRCVNALTLELLETPFEASIETAQILNWLADCILRVQLRQYSKLTPELRVLILGGSSEAAAGADA